MLLLLLLLELLKLFLLQLLLKQSFLMTLRDVDGILKVIIQVAVFASITKFFDFNLSFAF